MALGVASTDPSAGPSFRLVETTFGRLDGFAEDDLAAAACVLLRSARAVASGHAALRAAVERPGWATFCGELARVTEPADGAAAYELLQRHFSPHRIEAGEQQRGFLTGYYEPVVEGSRLRTTDFTAPLLAWPAEYARLGSRAADRPFPTRAEIEAWAEAGGGEPVVWLRDWVEVFFVHVQGSARVGLVDGGALRLVYDGRNGQPYTSIGRILVEEQGLRPEDVSLEPLKRWIRAQGQAAGDPGRMLMQRNRSYIFFRSAPVVDESGPIGAQGLPLEPLRSIAIDRTLWPYGLPFWIEAELPWRSDVPSPFRRLMIAQDTGSAIVGPARADLFFGSGAAAGDRAGVIRHPADMTVLLPRDVAP